MATFVLRRLLSSIPVLVLASFLIFTGVSLAGDPLGTLRQTPNLSQQTIDNIVERKHLDEPLLVRYGHWVREAVSDDFGTTLLSDRPIWPDLRRAIGNTLQLIIAAEIVALTLAIGIGVLSAVRQYSFFDYFATTFSFFGFSMPIFWFALILQVLFTNIYLVTGTRIFYTSQLPPAGAGPLLWMQHLGLPVIALALLATAEFSRYLRGSMLEVINSDYVRTARAKGLSERKVVLRHAFRNALIPLTTVATLNFATLFGGAIVTESVFSLNGMGIFFINNLASRDIYPLMAWLMVSATAIILFNLLADILYGILDPRIRYD